MGKTSLHLDLRCHGGLSSVPIAPAAAARSLAGKRGVTLGQDRWHVAPSVTRGQGTAAGVGMPLLRPAAGFCYLTRYRVGGPSAKRLAPASGGPPSHDDSPQRPSSRIRGT